ncbi:MAG TPA: response regulator, partial [Gemmatimonadaceae bacterium]|nr:response regulator [Gemmatimonadaceae bacterium]
MSILIADDDRVTTTMLASKLKGAGYQTLVAVDAMQTLMLAQKHQLEAVLLDINMPGGSGIMALQRLKGSSKTSNVPVIVVSASEDPEMPDKVRGMGADEFLKKPVDYDAL